MAWASLLACQGPAQHSDGPAKASSQPRQRMGEHACIELVKKYDKFVEEDADAPSLDRAILSRCHSDSNPDDVEVQACLQRADNAAAMRRCVGIAGSSG